MALCAGLVPWATQGLAQPSEALVLYRAERFEEARALLETAHQGQPEPATRRLLGLSYYRLLDYDRALPLLEQSLAEQAGDAQVRRALAEIRLELNNPAAARTLAEPLLMAEPGADTRYLWGRIQEALGESALAEEAYRAALNTAGPSLQQAVAVRLGQLYLRRGETRAARALADRAVALDPDSLDAETLRVLAAGVEDDVGPEQPAGLTLGYRLEYDDNAALVSDRGAAVIDEADTDDFRHLLYGDALGQWELGQGFKVFGEAHLSHGWHQDLDQFDFSRQNYVASLGWDGEQLGVRLPLGYFRSDEDGERVLGRWSLTPGAYYRFSDTALLYGFVRLDDNDYRNPGGVAAEDRSGQARSLGALLRLASADGRGQLRAIVEYGSNDSDGANWDRERLRLYLYGSYRFSDRLLFGLGGEYLDDDYDNRHDLFGEIRDDRIGAVFALLSYRLSRHWTLQGQLSHEVADSNLAFYDYDRTVVSVGFNWRF